jgi:hypothetical protein
MRVDVVRPFDYAPDGISIVHVLAGVQELPEKWGSLAVSEGWARPVAPDAAATKQAAAVGETTVAVTGSPKTPVKAPVASKQPAKKPGRRTGGK